MTPTNHITIPFSELEAEGARSWTEFKTLLLTIPGAAEVPAIRRTLQRSLAKCNQNLYTYFPFIFQDGFPKITTSQLRNLSISALLLLYHSLLTDRLVDRDKEVALNTAALFANQGTLLWAWNLLDTAAGERPLPWSDLLADYREFGLALLRESQQHAGKPSAYSDEDLIHIIARKSALAKIITTTMCYLGDRPEAAQYLANSLDSWNLSSNLMDDLEDWKVDLRKRRFTYLLTIAIDELGGWPALCHLNADCMQERIGKHIYSSGLINRYLTRAISCLDVSAESAELAECQRWASYINAYKCRLIARKNQIESALRELVVEHCGGRFTPVRTAAPKQSRSSPVSSLDESREVL